MKRIKLNFENYTQSLFFIHSLYRKPQGQFVSYNFSSKPTITLYRFPFFIVTFDRSQSHHHQSLHIRAFRLIYWTLNKCDTKETKEAHTKWTCTSYRVLRAKKYSPSISSRLEIVCLSAKQIGTRTIKSIFLAKANLRVSLGQPSIILCSFLVVTP